jgi:hypothetical protein
MLVWLVARGSSRVALTLPSLSHGASLAFPCSQLLESIASSGVEDESDVTWERLHPKLDGRLVRQGREGLGHLVGMAGWRGGEGGGATAWRASSAACRAIASE